MSERGERTEKPTPKRRREARRRGQVARSAELTGALVLVAGALAIAARLPEATRVLVGLVRTLLGSPAVAPRLALATAAGAALRIAGPIVGIVVVTAIGATLLQVGPLVSTEAVRPDAGRLDPARGLRRLVSFQRLGMVLKTAAALALALLVARHLVLAHLADVLRLPGARGARAALVLARLLPGFVAAAGASFVLLGVTDLLLGRRRLEKDLMMTRQEIRDEHKHDEGDPEHKAARRRAHRRIVETPARPLKDATVVVVNPTHVAVALHHGADLEVPEVGVRGTGDDAARIRADARSFGVPLVRDVPLARALLAVEPGDAVPEPLYAAVAAVLAAVYRARDAAPIERRNR